MSEEPEKSVRRLNLKLSPELHQAYRVACLSAQKSLQDQTTLLIEEFVQQQKGTARKK